MSINPLDYRNNKEEIIEIISCTVVPSVSASMIFSFGTFEMGSEDNRRFVSALFAAPIRVDIFDDEGSNLQFVSDQGFEKISKNIPGVICSKNSEYLRSYLKQESWVEAHSGKDIAHYVIWSYGGGVVHILSSNPPKLEEI